MPLRIRLLGRPTLERDGERVRLDGRKTWAMLAFIALASPAPTRRAIVERLWSNADDPNGALRWALSQVRKALAPEATIEERDDRLVLAGTLSVDAREVLDGAWDDVTADDAARGDLLEGIDAGPAEFERWLSVQRARLASARIDTIRTRAAVLAHTAPLRALELAERGLAFAPFDDALHQLIVECHLARGDVARAQAYVTATSELYERELGLPAPRALLRAVSPRGQRADRTISFGFAVEARTLLETAIVRGTAGAWDDARRLAMRAIDAAVAASDRVLEVRGLLQLTTVLTCELDGGPSAWDPLLQRALAVASELEDELLLADVEIARGRISSIEARYGAAEASFRRALQTAERLGDDARLARIHAHLGICETDRCDYDAAERDLRTAVELVDRPENTAVWLARCLLLAGRADEAEEIARHSIESMRARSVVFQLPLAEIVAAEVLRGRGSLHAASDLFAAAFTLAREIGDIDWTTLSLRGLAWIDRSEGRPERALATLRDATGAAMQHQGCIRWVRAMALTDLVEWERGADVEHVEEALRLARTAPMPDLAARLARFAPAHVAAARSHTLSHTVGA